MKKILVIALSLILSGVFFLIGGIAHKKCTFPFCRGYYERFSQNDSNNEKPITVEENITRIRTDTIETNLYDLKIQRYSLTERTLNKRVWGLKLGGRDGGIDNLDNDLLLASKDGGLFYLDEELNIDRLPFSVPFSKNEFLAFVEGTKYTESTLERRPITEEWFTVKDILVIRESSDQFRLLASYNHWNAERECHTLKVSQIMIGKAADSLTADGHAWSDLYETTPCLTLKDTAHPFGGLQSGGRMVQLSGSEILVAVGDFEFDGIAGQSLPQDPANSYGKTIRIDLNTGSTQLFTLGHRNPQGLHIDAEGRIWSTEHGPRGGDELNLIQEGLNYGWPEVTYGTCYGHEAAYYEGCNRLKWPLAPDGSHEGFTRPTLAWVPSVGISQLTSIQRDRFAAWRGDLIVASLSKRTLYRMRVRNGRVVLSEPIGIGVRVRDLVERPDGSLVLKSDGGQLHVIEPVGKTKEATASRR